MPDPSRRSTEGVRHDAHDGFERTLSDWLDEQAGRGVPDYLDEVLARTTRTRQRPAWSSLERWLPMDPTAPPRPRPADAGQGASRRAS